MPKNKKAYIEVIGVYPISRTSEPVFLIELFIRDFKGKIDFGEFGQNVSSLGAARDQVAYKEYLLNDDGTSGAEPRLEPWRVEGNARVAFFLHYLDVTKPINTPLGTVLLPTPKRRPPRLKFIKYMRPC